MYKNITVLVLSVIVVLLTSCNRQESPASSKLTNLKDSASYAMGVMIAQQYIKQDIDSLMDRQLTFSGITDILQHDTCLLSQAELTAAVSAYSQKIIEEKYNSVKIAGEEFLANNLTNTGIIQTANGMQYKVEKEGNANEHPSISDNINMQFVGKKIDGTVFGNSGSKTTYSISSLPRGLADGILLMTPGAKYTFYLPYYLAFGETGYQTVEPYSTVIFEVELINIEKN